MYSEYFENSYHNEVKRRNTLNARFPFVVAVYGIVFTAIKYYIDIALNKGLSIEYMQIFWLLLAVAFLTLTFSIFYLFKCIFGYTYSYVPLPKKVWNTIIEIKEYEKKYPEGFDGDEYIQKNIAKKFCDCAEVNMKNNNTKSKYFHLLMVTQAISISAVICLTMYYYGIVLFIGGQQ